MVSEGALAVSVATPWDQEPEVGLLRLVLLRQCMPPLNNDVYSGLLVTSSWRGPADTSGPPGPSTGPSCTTWPTWWMLWRRSEGPGPMLILLPVLVLILILLFKIKLEIIHCLITLLADRNVLVFQYHILTGQYQLLLDLLRF